MQALEQALVHELVEELEVLGAMRQGIADEVLHERLGDVHVAGQVAEGHLGLDHPELGGMARGVGVLGAEGGAEGVDVAERAGESLALQLPAHGQVGRTPEEIGRGVGALGGIEGRHAEQLARALAVAGGDDGRVHVGEPAFLEEVVDGVGQAAAHAEHGAEEVGARPQVRDGAQELGRVALLLQRVGLVGRAHDAERRGLDFPLLPAALGGDERPRDRDRGAGEQVAHGGVVGQRGVDDHLEVPEAGAVVELHEADPFESRRVRTHPQTVTSDSACAALRACFTVRCFMRVI